MTQETKKKIIEILITAIISAAIATLQGILATYTSNTSEVPNPEIAAGIGGAIRTATLFFRSRD